MVSLTSLLSLSECLFAAAMASTPAVKSFPIVRMSNIRTASSIPVIIAPPTVPGCSLHVASPAKNKQLLTSRKLFWYRVDRVVRAGRTRIAFYFVTAKDMAYLLDLHFFLKTDTAYTLSGIGCAKYEGFIAETTAAEVCSKLKALYMTKPLANKLYLKKLYAFYMPDRRNISEHIDEFNKIVIDLENIERNCPKNNPKKSTCYVKEDDQPTSSGSIYNCSEVMMVMSAKALLDWIMDSGEKEGMGKKGAGVNNGGRKLKSINDSAGNVIVVSKSSIDGAVDDTIIGEDGKPSMDVLGGLNKDERNVIMDVIMALCGKFLAATSDN
ncbi:hypothetical protein Tco_0403645, partial [Tanacetum coccineum]